MFNLCRIFTLYNKFNLLSRSVDFVLFKSISAPPITIHLFLIMCFLINNVSWIMSQHFRYQRELFNISKLLFTTLQYARRRFTFVKLFKIFEPVQLFNSGCLLCIDFIFKFAYSLKIPLGDQIRVEILSTINIELFLLTSNDFIILFFNMF